MARKTGNYEFYFLVLPIGDTRNPQSVNELRQGRRNEKLSYSCTRHFYLTYITTLENVKLSNR